ncbi:LuxR C-terminal-related transcriptional regulator [Snuella lapsa]|uniref:HTH luxR-type domain-containing protein n=1 Tax=Snuella lapsa TaxID=870481 RepID=A0ABP6X5R0_9FLAO
MKYIFVIVIFLCNLILIQAQTFTPDIKNYTIENYDADNQNWDIDVDENGVVFIANNKGLLRYNGQSWQLYELPNKTIIRSVLCVSDRIYTGSYEEFGFWKKDDFGDYYYTSLNQYFTSDHKIDNEQFWQIVSYKNKIIFKSFARGLYVYDGDRISYIENSFGTYDVSVFQNDLLVTNSYRGLERLNKDKLEPYQMPNRLSYDSSLAYNISSYQSLLFLYDSKQGGFVYDSEKLIPLPQKVNLYLGKNVLNKVVFADESNLAFGSIKDGITIYNFRTNNIRHVNKNYGLINNTVLGLTLKEENLWVALDNGLTKIDLESPFTFFKDFTGTLGTVYDVTFFENSYYLGSNTGVYRLSETGELILINDSEGQVWDLKVLNDQILVGHNEGSFLVEDDIWSKRLSDRGVYCSVEIPEKENWFLQGTYYGINLLRKEKDRWYSHEIEEVPFLVNNIAFESDEIIWVTHPYKGVYRILLDNDYKKVLKITPYGDNQKFKQYQTNVYNIENNILLYNSGNWFKYFKEKDSIGVFDKLEKYQNKVIVGKEEMGVWVNDRNNNTLTFVNNSFEEQTNINTTSVKKRLVSKYEKVIYKNDSLRIMNLNDGFMLFDINNPKNKTSRLKSPVIDKIYTKNKKVPLESSSNIKIPFNEARTLTVESYLPNNYGVDLNYALSGRIDETGIIKEGKLILQNLPYGDYTLHLNNPYANNLKGFNKELKFSVLSPWYLSNIMKLIYFIFILGVLYIGHKINTVKIRREQIKKERAYIRENQKRIQEIEKQNLEKEIFNKKNELTNSTKTIIKKNETITLLGNELGRLLDMSPNKSRTKRLINLSKNKVDIENDWKTFEANFNELHHDFFTRLAASFPSLTSKDLKLCAYIKTGLSSKEIAPLMGITTRGIEIHRYRLRKKINLDAGNSLANFLITF